MKYKAIIADVDGTLLVPNAPAETPASEKVILAVKKAQKKGLKFSLATARSLEWISGLIKSLQPQAPLVLDNGARVYDLKRKRYIHKALLSNVLVKEVLTVMKQFKHDIFVVDESNRFLYTQTSLKQEAIKIMILHISPQLAHKIFQRLTIFPDIAVTKSISGVNPPLESIHVTSSAATKEEGVIKVAQYLNTDTSRFIGIGDSYNDAGFLDICGLKVAMENSVPMIKEIADYIAPSVNDDGVAEVISKFILNEKKI